jgi:hypothetical protein
MEILLCTIRDLLLTKVFYIFRLVKSGKFEHIYTQTMHRTTQLTTLVGRLSGIRTQSGQTKISVELTA